MHTLELLRALATKTESELVAELGLGKLAHSSVTSAVSTLIFIDAATQPKPSETLKLTTEQCAELVAAGYMVSDMGKTYGPHCEGQYRWERADGEFQDHDTSDSPDEAWALAAEHFFPAEAP